MLPRALSWVNSKGCHVARFPGFLPKLGISQNVSIARRRSWSEESSGQLKILGEFRQGKECLTLKCSQARQVNTSLFARSDLGW